jgi:hypothetical protein
MRKKLPADAKFAVGERTAFKVFARAEKEFMEGDLRMAAVANVSAETIQKRAFNYAIRRLVNTRVPANFSELSKARRARVRAPTAVALEAGADPTAKEFDWRKRPRHPRAHRPRQNGARFMRMLLALRRNRCDREQHHQEPLRFCRIP